MSRTVSRRSLLKGMAAAGAATAIAKPAEARERRHPGPDAVGMLYDSTLCIGCRACVTKCKEVNRKPPDLREIDGAGYDAPIDLNGTTPNVIKLYVEGGRTAFVKAQCMHCVDPACVSVCMIGALHKLPNGVVAYDRDGCIGCRYCQVACPFNVPKFEWGSATPQIVKCELCRHRKEGPACAEVCPREAVIYGRLKDLAAEAHRRIEAAPGRYERRVYGETEAGGTQVLYLSAAGIPFAKLGLPALGPDPLPELSESVQHGIYQGFIAPAAIYVALGVVVWRNRKRSREGGEERP